MLLPLPIDLLIGAERAGQFINARVRALTERDWIPESLAYEMVCTGVLDGDPWTLVDAGQRWLPRDSAPDEVPAELYVVHRRGAQVLLEDEYGQRATYPLAALYDTYYLHTWHWSHEDAPAASGEGP